MLARLLLALGTAACAPAASTSSPLGSQPAAPVSAGATAAVPPAALEPVHIGYPSYSIGYLPIFAAQAAGYYQEQGLSVELVQIRPAAGITALINGDIEYLAGFATTIRTALQGAPARIVLMTARAPLFSLVVRPAYTALVQLRGKTVGITTFGGTVEHDGVDTVGDSELEAGKDLPRLTFEQLVDASLAVEAQRELGLRQ